MTNPLQKNPLLHWLLAGANGAEPTQRAAVYARLVRSNLVSVIEEAFPVTRQILADSAFESRIQRFLVQAGPTTYFYRDIPRDFLHWVQAETLSYSDLMAYEWLQFEAARHPVDLALLEPIKETVIRPNPTMQIGVYERAVHAMDPNNPSPEVFAQPMAYLVWRRPHTDAIAFQRVGLAVARFLGLASTGAQTLDELCNVLETEGTLSSAKEVGPVLAAVVQELRARDGLL